MTFLHSYKLFVLLMVTFRYNLLQMPTDEDHWILFCEKDLATFGSYLGSEQCQMAFSKYNFEDKGFINAANSLFGDRNIQYATTGGKKVVLKRLATQEKLDEFTPDCSKSQEEILADLKFKYSDENRAEGSLICGDHTRFRNETKNKFPEVMFWLYMNLNIQPLVLTVFHGSNLPIPAQVQTIGFTSVTTFEGQTTAGFFSSSFKSRLKIASLILEGVLEITNGHNGFRIYMTDLTLDNVVVDAELSHVAFIDLDNVLIVDTRNPFVEQGRHTHEKIDCDGCFAYSPKEVCSASLSDLNLFAACQLLNEDLHGDTTKGFLHSIPEEFSVIRQNLTDCVNCIGCDRFESAFEILDLFDEILKIL